MYNIPLQSNTTNRWNFYEFRFRVPSLYFRFSAVIQALYIHVWEVFCNIRQNKGYCKMSYSSLEIHDADCQGDHILYDKKTSHLLPSDAKNQVFENILLRVCMIRCFLIYVQICKTNVSIRQLTHFLKITVLLLHLCFFR